MVYQAMDALDYGDGVSNSVINTATLLSEMGINNSVYSKWAHQSTMHLRNDIDNLKVNDRDIILLHYSGYNHIIEDILKLNCKKVLVYHNITPPSFFKDTSSEAYKNCLKGYEQIKRVIKDFDFVTGDSKYNMNDLLEIGATNAELLPIAMDLDSRKINDINPNIVKRYKKSDTIFFFAGRVAPNKRHEDIIDIFNEYFTYIDSSAVLILAGNNEYQPEYMSFLSNKLHSLLCRDSVVFTGKISDKDIRSYYSIANAFICMSEHEGFCIPLIEAMHSRIPVFAYNSCAVPYTMGNSGILISKKNFREIAELINVILQNDTLKSEILLKQDENVALYLNSNMKKILRSLLQKWRYIHE